MTTSNLFAALALLLFATQAGAATLLTMTGTVNFEDYGPNPSPLAAAADSVEISVTYDDSIEADAEFKFGDTRFALYNSAVLETRIDIFDLGGGLLDSIDAPDAFFNVAYQPSTGNSEFSLSSSFEPSLGSPFVELDVYFFGVGMFDSILLEQVTDGHLAFANLLATGDLETEPKTFSIDGIGFEIDLASLSVTPNTPAPSPVPAPPAILAMMAGLLGLGVAARLKPRTPDAGDKAELKAAVC